MIPSLLLSLLLISPVFAQEVPPALGEVETFETLSKYLYYNSQGGIRPVQDSYLSFRISKRVQEAIPVLPESNYDLIYSLWETDVERIIRNSGTPDFVSAKKKFYRAQTFNQGTQQYSRPYVYPSDWYSLFHNPIRKPSLPNEVYGQQFADLDPKTIEQSPLLDVNLHRKLDGLTNSEMTAGNKLHLLNNGEISFKEKVRMVRESKKFFHSVVMVQYCDESSTEIIDAMIERARAGVDVRLIMEKAWTMMILKKCLAKLQNGGVKVHLGKGFFNPKTMFTVHHTKFWIRDGEEAIIGGQNMHDFENTSNGFNQHTRDKDVHVIGPAVTDLMREYIRIWNEDSKKPDATMTPFSELVAKKQKEERAQGLRGRDLYESWLHRDDVSQIPGVCRVLVQTSATGTTPSIISKAYIEIFKNVRYSMQINTPTFRYDQDSTNALDNNQIIKGIVDAGKKGVKIDLVSNGVDGGWGEAGHQLRLLAKDLRRKGLVSMAVIVEQIDKTVAIFVGKGNRKHLSKVLVGPNVDVWQYFNHIHSKQMMFDGIMTSTGSFNLDKHSYKNHESTMICLDKQLADESMKGFVSDIINSIPVL